MDLFRGRTTQTADAAPERETETKPTTLSPRHRLQLPARMASRLRTADMLKYRRPKDRARYSGKQAQPGPNHGSSDKMCGCTGRHGGSRMARTDNLVLKSRSGTPLLTRAKLLILCSQIRSVWGPYPRRSGPHHLGKFHTHFRRLDGSAWGSYFGAVSHSNGCSPTSKPAQII